MKRKWKVEISHLVTSTHIVEAEDEREAVLHARDEYENEGCYHDGDVFQDGRAWPQPDEKKETSG